MIQNGHVGIPLDIVYLRVFRHEVVNDGEHEVLHLGVREVEYQLRTTTTLYGVALGRLDNPVRMLLVELTHAIRHFWLYPDAKLDTVLLGVAQQSLDALRQFVLVNHPVAQ